jgi:hypothetical protein
MSKQWEYQLRIDLCDELAEVARRDPNNPAIKPLVDILTRHHATMKCQFDAFADYVAEAEKRGTKNYPLYAWTKATIENPEKRDISNPSRSMSTVMKCTLSHSRMRSNQTCSLWSAASSSGDFPSTTRTRRTTPRRQRNIAIRSGRGEVRSLQAQSGAEARTLLRFLTSALTSALAAVAFA